MSSTPVQDELLEIKDFDTYDRHITKLITVSRNEHMIVLICWFDLSYIILEIKNNIDFFDNVKYDPQFLIGTQPLLRFKP